MDDRTDDEVRARAPIAPVATTPTALLERFAPLIGQRHAERMRDAAVRARALLADRVVWNVSSTAAGGGVAEMLQTLLAYARGVGIDARWVVIDGDREFFRITKRIHNGLHGMRGDGGPLGDRERARYGATLGRSAEALRALVRPRDVVLLHDPQTAGLVPALHPLGAIVVWRCHVGHDDANGIVERTWAFLRPFLTQANAFVFSRAAYAPGWLDRSRVEIVPPSIDVFAPKNQPLSRTVVQTILAEIGLLADGRRNGRPEFARHDGSLGRVVHRARLVQEAPIADAATALVTQVSRWDRLKDMAGVMRGFVAHVAAAAPAAHLALVGPDVAGIADDPEGAAVYAECVAAWRALPAPVRRRVHLVSLPMDDLEENAAMVNAAQRHAAVVVQKSLHEGFGLTVTEAMWKARPVVASAVGGIQDQIVDERHGLLVRDPLDLRAFAHRVCRLLSDRPLARRLGRNARRRSISRYLAPRHLIQYVDLFARLDRHR